VKRLAPKRVRTQQRPKKQHKLYALHAPDMECIGKHRAGKDVPCAQSRRA